MVYALALFSALCYGAASVLQQRSARATEHPGLRLRFLASLFSSPAWLIGSLADIAGYVLQFLALRRGAIAVVQPLLVCGLLFALILGALLEGGTLHRRDWGGGCLVVAGLAVFLVSAAPARGRFEPHLLTWTVILATTLVPAGALILASQFVTDRPHRPWRALTLSAASGILYGLTAALTKSTGGLLLRGPVHVLTHWPLYALIAIGAVGLLVGQSAFQSGSLQASLPTLSVVDPVVSVVIGAVGFGESINIRGASIPLEALGLGATVVGVVLLAGTRHALGERS